MGEGSEIGQPSSWPPLCALGSVLGVASQLSQNEFKGIVFANLVLLLAVLQGPTTISLRNLGAKSFLTAFRIPASPPPLLPPEGHTPRVKGHRFWVSASCPAWLASCLGRGGFRRPTFGSVEFRIVLQEEMSQRLTEACRELRFVCHAVQDGPWSQVDIYLKSNELKEYSVENREGKYSILLKEGIATFSYCKVALGV